MEWQIADAKNHLSELVTRALEEGPQRITRRKQAVVVMDEAEYQRLTSNKLPFNQFLLNAPKVPEFEFVRDKTPLRDLDF